MSKTRVGVIFGGRSGEHEVSLVSAASIIKALSCGNNAEVYDVIQIGIDKEGHWLTGENCLDLFRKNSELSLEKKNFLDLDLVELAKGFGDLNIDIVFPVLHGPFGEDGTIQGLFEMLQMPYVGCGVLASSTAMDKLQCKAIWQSAGLPIVPHIGFSRKIWREDKQKIVDKILKELGLPCFVKPANLGSAVGITKAKTKEELGNAIEEASKYDSRIVVEKAVNAREIECSVLGNDDPIASPLGEVLVGGEFYDFYDKYVNGVSKTKLADDLDEKMTADIQDMVLKAYKLLDCSGLARVDSFLDRDDGKIYLNEINTMPGFTSISMFPQLIEAAGISYDELVDKLIQLGMERFKDKQENKIVFDSGSDWYN
jgi:D-alanine-D-alanine ligase